MNSTSQLAPKIRAQRSADKSDDCFEDVKHILDGGAPPSISL